MKIAPFVWTLTCSVSVFLIQEWRIHDAKEAFSVVRKGEEAWQNQRRFFLTSNELLEDGPVSYGSRPEKTHKTKEDRLRAGVSVNVPGHYARLSEMLELTDEERAYFESILVHRAIVRLKYEQKWERAELAERGAVLHELDSKLGEIGSEIERFLNDHEDLALFNRYEARLPEQNYVSEMKDVLSLEAEVEAGLVDVLYRCRVEAGEVKADCFSVWRSLVETGDYADLVSHWERTDDLLVQELPQVLPQEKVGTFLSYWERRREMQRKEYEVTLRILREENS